MDLDHKQIIKKLEDTWRELMRNFRITMSLKIHIIIHHISDYVELTNKTLRTMTDQVVEEAQFHQWCLKSSD